MVKRLNIEIPWEQYEILRREAALRSSTVSAVIRDLIDGLKQPGRKRRKRPSRDDPFYTMKGTFAGPSDLAEKHDAYLYGGRR